MKRALAALAAFGAIAAGLLSRMAPVTGSVNPGPPTTPADVDVPDVDIGGWIADALPDFTSQQLPVQNAGQESRNLAAFLAMIRAAEGTAGQGGYGALFGWPNVAGRSFDPFTIGGHPRIFFKYTNKAGQELNVSPAGAYQIVWTTWNSRRLAFLAWAGLNGLSVTGFLPATQDAFAMYLLHVRGALDDVKAGRFAVALNKARVEWASLPGANVNQPERTDAFVLAAYVNAGGVVA